MRVSTIAAWREFLSGYRHIHFYTVDPGAHAIATELVPIAESLNQMSGWYAEGWSADRNLACRPAAALISDLGAGDTLLLGSQTNYSRTRQMTRDALNAGAKTMFVFDHWKNYAEHFDGKLMPDIIVVQDSIARDHLVAAVEGASARVRILPHPGIDAAAERVASYGHITEPATIAMLLDPTEAADGLGYDWRGCLAAAVQMVKARPGARLLVKPHPRQDASTIEREITNWIKSGVTIELYSGETERLIALASEVWGMTTVALNVALVSGKRIRSFQPGRNEAGARASNPHIEPFTITGLR